MNRSPRPPRRVRRGTLLGALGIGLAAICVVSMTSGALPLSVREVVDVLTARLGRDVDVSASAEVAVMQLRAPRLLLGIGVGAALGLAGAGLQGVFRNPLADPSLIGVSSGAALGAVAAIVVGIDTFGRWSIAASAFLGAVLAVTIIYRTARRHGRTDVVTLLLTGIAINAIAGAVIGFLVFRSTDTQLRTLTFWQLGSLADATWPAVWIVTLPVVVGAAVLLGRTRALNLLGLGEREAGHAGVDTARLIVLVVGASALITGVAVAFAGIVAFVGLAVPHLIRLVAGPDHRTLVPAAALGGAVLVTAADVTARTVVAPRELPLGVVTTAVGGTVFLVLLWQRRRGIGARW